MVRGRAKADEGLTNQKNELLNAQKCSVWQHLPHLQAKTW